jgi:ATP-dependent DNA helicase RecG
MAHPQKTLDEIDVQFVKGVGETRAKQLKKYGISSVQDLLNHIPRRYLDRSTITRINQVSKDEEATIIKPV